MRFQHIVSIVLLLLVAGLLVWASERYSWTADWTAGNRASLTDASRQVLQGMPHDIRFEAYAAPGPLRSDIRLQIQRYQRERAGIALEFIDPATQPQRMRELGVRSDGEVRLFYQGRNESLQDLSEQSITRALQRLAGGSDQWVVFLTGHGERDPHDESDGGYALLAAELEAQGMRPRPLNLGNTPSIPDNAAMLVIASPQNNLLPGEVKIINDYLDRGGNLLWLDDPGKPVGLKPLAAHLDLKWLPGTVIYPDFRQLGTGHPAMALVVSYPRHPITERLSSLSLFPVAGGLQAGTQNSGWTTRPILQTPPRSWLETGSLEGAEAVFSEADNDHAGPITLGLALQRQAPASDTPTAGNEAGAAESSTSPETSQSQQRAVVVADSDFLTNANINALGNMQLGISMFQWLAARDEQISVQVPLAPDSRLLLPPWQGRLVWLIFVVLLPPLFLLIGLGRWWLRRRR